MSKHEEEEVKKKGGLFISVLSTLKKIGSKTRLNSPESLSQENSTPVNTSKKCLTEPSLGRYNDGNDNSEHNLILYENEIIKNRYRVVKVLGKGVYGVVFLVLDIKNSNKPYAVKIIKNHPLFHRQARIEVAILKQLNTRFGDNEKGAYIVKMTHVFQYKGHLCIFFECLGKNLFELVQHRGYNGIPLKSIAYITKQMLVSMRALEKCNIIHCDLKPENVLLNTNDLMEGKFADHDEEISRIGEKQFLLNEALNKKYQIKVIDFGSACFEHSTPSWYIQSRFYRAPEILLGIEYDTKIDLWSLGCIAAELYLGIPIFPGCSAYDQVSKMVGFLGVPPDYIIESGKFAKKFFENVSGSRKGVKYALKSEEKYCFDSGDTLKGGKRYFKESTLKGVILNHNDISSLPQDVLKMEKERLNSKIGEEKEKDESKEKEREELVEWNKNRKKALLDFIKGLLRWDTTKRWTCEEAMDHPFVTGEKWRRPYRPKYRSRKGILISNKKTGVNNNPSSSSSSSSSSASSGQSIKNIPNKINPGFPSMKQKQSYEEGPFDNSIKTQGHSYYEKPSLGVSPQDSAFSYGSSYDSSGPFFFDSSPYNSPNKYYSPKKKNKKKRSQSFYTNSKYYSKNRGRSKSNNYTKSVGDWNSVKTGNDNDRNSKELLSSSYDDTMKNQFNMSNVPSFYTPPRKKKNHRRRRSGGNNSYFGSYDDTMFHMEMGNSSRKSTKEDRNKRRSGQRNSNGYGLNSENPMNSWNNSTIYGGMMNLGGMNNFDESSIMNYGKHKEERNQKQKKNWKRNRN